MSDPIDDFEDLFQNAPCGYLTLKAGVVHKANATLAGWLGFAADELVGKPFHQLLGISGRLYLETHIAPLLRMQGSFSEIALDFHSRSGERIPTITSAVERRDDADNQIYVRMVVFKALQRRRYERELVRTISDERHTSELREQFIAVLGHDLRNPMASLTSAVRVLGREPGRTDKDRQILDAMHSTVMRMAGLVDDLMDFAKGRLGAGIPVERDNDKPLEPVLHQVIGELSTDQRPIECHFNFRDPINCDRSRIGQMLSNLLGNALTHGAADQPVKVFAVSDDTSFEISVVNAGPAIPEATLAQLFQPFFRGKVRKIQQGLGLGLYIASEIAAAHGGKLSVSSEEGQTEFKFRMPLFVEARSSPEYP